MKKNILLLMLVIFLAIIPFYVTKNAEFAGADDQTKGIISEVKPNYKPWFSPVFKPPSSEIESLIFALQASIGTGIIAYFIGLSKGRSEKSTQ